MDYCSGRWKTYYWLGYKAEGDAHLEYNWKWTDGTNTSFHAWGYKQPPGGVHGQYCAASRTINANKWVTRRCSNVYHYLCQIQSDAFIDNKGELNQVDHLNNSYNLGYCVNNSINTEDC